MANKPTYEELEQKVKELEQESIERKKTEEEIQNSKVLNGLKKIEEGKYEKIHIQSDSDMEGLSQVINRISRKMRESEQKLNILFEITRFVSSLLHQTNEW